MSGGKVISHAVNGNDKLYTISNDSLFSTTHKEITHDV